MEKPVFENVTIVQGLKALGGDYQYLAELISLTKSKPLRKGTTMQFATGRKVFEFKHQEYKIYFSSYCFNYQEDLIPKKLVEFYITRNIKDGLKKHRIERLSISYLPNTFEELVKELDI